MALIIPIYMCNGLKLARQNDLIWAFGGSLKFWGLNKQLYLPGAVVQARVAGTSHVIVLFCKGIEAYM